MSTLDVIVATIGEARPPRRRSAAAISARGAPLRPRRFEPSAIA